MLSTADTLGESGVAHNSELKLVKHREGVPRHRYAVELHAMGPDAYAYECLQARARIMALTYRVMHIRRHQIVFII